MGRLRCRLWIATWPRPLLEVYERRRVGSPQEVGPWAGMQVYHTCPGDCITRSVFVHRDDKLQEDMKSGKGASK